MQNANAAPAPGPFADATPLGLICLAVGCASLLPVAFGHVSPASLETAAVFCLLFGFGGQLFAGLMNLANRNQLGGTLFTAFAFNWLVNAWALHSLSKGVVPDESVLLSVDVLYLVLFLPLTYAFGFVSRLLVVFLLDIDLLYAARIARAAGHLAAMNTPIAVLTVALAAISVWIAVGMLLNPIAGRQVIPFPGPLFAAQNDSPVRRAA